MSRRFSKSEYLGATRRLLADLTWWLSLIFTEDLPTRLFGIDEKKFDASPEKWMERGFGGQEIEHSKVCRSMERILDCLNTNTWYGDADSLRWELKELRPLYELVTAKRALVDPDEGKVALGGSAKLFREVFELASAHVALDMGLRLTVREMACVSGLAEKTIRMAATGRHRNPELATIKVGSHTLIEADEARRWLATKGKAYQTVQYIGKGSLPAARPSSTRDLGHCLSDLRDAREIRSVEQLATTLQWDEARQQAYELLEGGEAEDCAALLTLDEIIALADVLCPAESAELARRIDATLHPISVEQQLSRHRASQTENRREEENVD